MTAHIEEGNDGNFAGTVLSGESGGDRSRARRASRQRHELGG